MSDFWSESVYAQVEREARADWDGERLDEDRPTRAEADEDAERPWSRAKWIAEGNGYV